MFKVASLNGNGANQTLLNMNNLVEGNIHGGIINNTTGTKQNVKFIVGTVEFPLKVEANSIASVSKINVPTGTTVQINAPTGVNVSVSYFQTTIDTSSALTTLQGLVSEANSSATNASNSATNASNSATNANFSEESANESQINAYNSEIMASKWSENPEDIEVLTGQYSAYHWARKAQAVVSGEVIDDEVISDLLTWSSEKIVEKIDNIQTLPIGAILNGYTIFDNCIVAFGGEFNRADYPKLWTYLQANSTLVKTETDWQTEATANDGICGFFSDGNGTTTFRVPNLDKAFLRPNSRGVASYQADEFKAHNHTNTFQYNGVVYNYLGTFTHGNGAQSYSGTTGGTETRPKNIAVLPLIVAE